MRLMTWSVVKFLSVAVTSMGILVATGSHNTCEAKSRKSK